MSKLTRAFAILIVTGLTLSGCATATQQSAMVVDAASIEIVNRHQGSVDVEVVGGSETSAFGTPQVETGVMKATIEESLNNASLFNGGVVAEQGDYRLIATFMDLDQPIFGLKFDVVMGIAWQLHGKDGKTIWRKVIESTGTAGFGDAAVAATRLRVATERSVKANIESAISELSSLSIATQIVSADSNP